MALPGISAAIGTTFVSSIAPKPSKYTSLLGDSINQPWSSFSDKEETPSGMFKLNTNM